MGLSSDVISGVLKQAKKKKKLISSKLDPSGPNGEQIGSVSLRS